MRGMRKGTEVGGKGGRWSRWERGIGRREVCVWREERVGKGWERVGGVRGVGGFGEGKEGRMVVKGKRVWNKGEGRVGKRGGEGTKGSGEGGENGGGMRFGRNGREGGGKVGR